MSTPSRKLVSEPVTGLPSGTEYPGRDSVEPNPSSVDPVDPEIARDLSAATEVAQQAAIVAKAAARQRDLLIVRAYRSGAGPREIARYAGISHPAVRKILLRDIPDELGGEEG